MKVDFLRLQKKVRITVTALQLANLNILIQLCAGAPSEGTGSFTHTDPYSGCEAAHCSLDFLKILGKIANICICCQVLGWFALLFSKPWSYQLCWQNETSLLLFSLYPAFIPSWQCKGVLKWVWMTAGLQTDFSRGVYVGTFQLSKSTEK